MATHSTRSELKIYHDPEKPSSYYGWWISHTCGSFNVDVFSSKEEQETFLDAVRVKLKEVSYPFGNVETIAAFLALCWTGNDDERNAAEDFLADFLDESVQDVIDAFEEWQF